MAPGNTRPSAFARRRVAVVTGSRAEYGLLESTIAAVYDDPRLELQLVVTGMHWLKKFGRTASDIEQDGWPMAARIRMQRGNDDPVDQAKGLARGVEGMAEYFEKARTQIVLVLGDRIEAMAGALAALTTGRILVHVHGGDIAPGDFDGPLRDAITKLAHFHLAATSASARRILQMGEQRRRIRVVGAPGLDRLIRMGKERNETVSRKGWALIVQHPCGRSASHEASIMTAILAAVADCGLNRTIIYPNTDRGHSGIIRAIQRHQKNSPKGTVNVLPSARRDDYLRALIGHDVLVGNSSSGIIEAGVVGTPSVNVGNRQHGRERDKQWVIDAKETPLSIRAALRRALKPRGPRIQKGPYGDGRTGRRIAECLARLPLVESFKRKVVRPVTPGEFDGRV